MTRWRIGGSTRNVIRWGVVGLGLAVAPLDFSAADPASSPALRAQGGLGAGYDPGAGAGFGQPDETGGSPDGEMLPTVVPEAGGAPRDQFSIKDLPPPTDHRALDLYGRPGSPVDMDLGRVLELYGVAPTVPPAAAGDPPKDDATATGDDDATREALIAVGAALRQQKTDKAPAQPPGSGAADPALSPLLADLAKDFARSMLEPIVEDDGTVSISVPGLGRVGLDRDRENLSENVMLGNPGSASSTAFGGLPTRTQPPVPRDSEDGIVGLIKEFLVDWVFYAFAVTVVILLMIVRRLAYSGH